MNEGIFGKTVFKVRKLTIPMTILWRKKNITG
jgi:hypothetical protein